MCRRSVSVDACLPKWRNWGRFKKGIFTYDSGSAQSNKSGGCYSAFLQIECRKGVSAIVEKSIYCRSLAYVMIRILRPSRIGLRLI
jgi:hypothetical protein